MREVGAMGRDGAAARGTKRFNRRERRRKGVERIDWEDEEESEADAETVLGLARLGRQA
jgi:hypothetical protein